MGFWDNWREVFDVLQRRKLRTVATVLSVAWGSLVLILLLATGRGLAKGTEREFLRYADNSVALFPRRTSIASGGLGKGRAIRFHTDDLRLLAAALPGVTSAAARLNLPREIYVRAGAQGSLCPIQGVSPASREADKVSLHTGRYIGERDVQARRRVAVLGKNVAGALFGVPAAAVGKRVAIDPFLFTVAGVVEKEQDFRVAETIYIPIAVAQGLEQSDRLHAMIFSLSETDPARLDAGLKGALKALGSRRGFDPSDKAAVNLTDTRDLQAQVRAAFAGIHLFLWVIGLGTLLAGVVAVSNIMLISVQERAKEFAVRRVIGARPRTIVAMVLREAAVLTVTSGCIGLLGGLLAIETASDWMPGITPSNRPDIEVANVVGAAAVLVVAGMIAGVLPALRAVRIRPIGAISGGPS